MESVTRIEEALAHFSAATGLIANMNKSNISVASMNDPIKEQLLTVTGFSQRVLPIRYLGMPLSSKKSSKLDCHLLIEKIPVRIKTTYARQLSYAGRLHVIIAVLFSIHNFWGSVFILRQSVVNEV